VGELPITRFGGLDLVSSPDEVGLNGAIDGLNFDLGVRGALRSRDGFDNFTGSELTNQPDSMTPYYVIAGTRQLLVGNGNRLDLLNTSGTSVASQNANASPHFFARFGSPSAEVIYIANGTEPIRKLSGTTFSDPAGMATQNGKFLAVTPQSNRLVIARHSSTLGGVNPSSVYFSNAGDAETFGANDWVDLDPGDGEAITGMIAWRDYIFVFKETKFWVYYGESTDDTGGAVFNFRKIATGIGLAASKALAVGREGVYFLDRTGVYLTSGGPPTLVSDPLDPLFSGGLSGFYQGSGVSQTSINKSAMAWFNERLYVAVPTGASTTNDRVLVYDPRHGYWLLWDIPAAALNTFRIGDTPELVFAYATGLNYVGRHSSAYTTDDGAALVSRYRSGLYDLGSPGREQRVTRTRLWGVGTVTWKTSRNWESLSTGTSAVLGTAPAVDDAYVANLSKPGHLMSHEISATSGQWVVHSLTHEVQQPRHAESRTP
jgi:hypothetical protein